ncbi:MAG: hypothetical protein K9M08_24220 [Pirellula sp.]|nr:hypothetical protein [Pirellula sp.]
MSSIVYLAASTLQKLHIVRWRTEWRFGETIVERLSSIVQEPVEITQSPDIREKTSD